MTIYLSVKTICDHLFGESESRFGVSVSYRSIRRFEKRRGMHFWLHAGLQRTERGRTEPDDVSLSACAGEKRWRAQNKRETIDVTALFSVLFSSHSLPQRQPRRCIVFNAGNASAFARKTGPAAIVILKLRTTFTFVGGTAAMDGRTRCNWPRN